MSALEPGKARMTYPDPGVDDAIVDASQVPHLEHAGWRYAGGDREDWPAELQRFGGERQVYIRNRITGGTAFVPELSGHLAERGWEEVDPEAEQVEAERAEQAVEGLTLEELKEVARDQGLPVSGTKAELQARLRDHEQQTTQAGQEPAASSEESEA